MTNLYDRDIKRLNIIVGYDIEDLLFNDIEKNFLLIPTSELNVHPHNQMEKMKRYIEISKSKPLIIKVHSGVVINLLNNIFLAYDILQKFPNKKEEVLKFFDEKHIIDPKEVCGYEYDNGEFKNLKNEEDWLESGSLTTVYEKLYNDSLDIIRLHNRE